MGSGALLTTPYACAQETWSLQAPATKPLNRFDFGLAYDSDQQKTIMFGGEVWNLVPGNPFVYDDTWMWSGGNWTRLTPTASPETRYNFAMTYDPVQKKILLYGGIDLSGTLFTNTWAWDGVTWTQLATTGPAGRQGLAMAYDPISGKVILFGGLDINVGYYGDTWAWDWTSSSWSQLSPSNAPTPRYEHRMVYDQARQQIVLFGGTGPDPSLISGNGVWNDTWTWSGTNWVQQFPMNPPASRYRHAMAYDHASTNVIVFGGVINGATCGADTWAWDGLGWTQLAPSTSPSCKEGAQMDFDVPTGQIVLFGGAGSAPADETWLYGNSTQSGVTINVPANVQFTFAGTSYTGTQTINVAPGTYTLSTTSPQSTGTDSQAVFVSWSDSGAISHQVTVGSTALSLTGTFKTQYMLRTPVAPVGGGSISPAAGFYDQGTPISVTATPSAGYAFAGFYGACSGTGACSFNLNGPTSVGAYFTYLYIGVPTGNQFQVNGVTYTNFAQLALGPGTYTITAITPLPALLGNPDMESLFAFWIVNGSGVRISSNPIAVTIGTSPVSVVGEFQGLGRISATAAPPSGGSVSLSPPSADGFYIPYGTPVTVTATPNPGFIFDSWSGACTGSGLCALTSSSGVQAVVAHFSRLENWVQLFPGKSPQKRNDAAMAYDPANQNIVLFGGEQGKPGTNGAVFGDTWTWDGANWSKRSPVLSPSPRWGAMMTYDAARNQVVLYGGRADSSGLPSAGLQDTWTWDFGGNTWRLAASAGPPRYEGSMIYDPQSTKVILFGGAPGPQNDTWAWDGVSWTKLAVTPSPSPRVSAGITYHAATNRVVLFGGGTTVNVAGEQGLSAADTWEWNGTGWVPETPSQIPTALLTPTMDYDPVSLQTIMFETQGSAGSTRQTWAWDGSTWFSRAPVSMPPGRDRQSMAYDAARGEIVMYGGVNLALNAPYDDTWVWLVPSVNLVPQQPTVTRQGNGNYVVNLPLANTGNVPVTNVVISSAMLGPASGGGGTINLVDRGTTGGFSFNVKVSAVPGNTASVAVQGTYSADGVTAIPWNATFLVNLP